MKPKKARFYHENVDAFHIYDGTAESAKEAVETALEEIDDDAADAQINVVYDDVAGYDIRAEYTQG
jgi:hypothetical protein